MCNSRLETQLSEVQAQLAKAEERANQSTRRLGRVEAEAKDIAQSVTSADMQLANLKIELQRKEAQIAALTSRQYMNATREMQTRAILNELIEMRGNIRVLIRFVLFSLFLSVCLHEMYTKVLQLNFRKD